ncbi:hypothetical protein ONE63_010013 [Megalurothrips usitatus]|uniref:G-protein coupled receptors family 1 profile domain-containing protein n=1 Tax=Megalurothrips usitatus TaxID=439358 RepID=A0AAV7XN07_9NEOP|nr:hypothetical protein ONE63_010013 [Megalurothrips usitatus]
MDLDDFVDAGLQDGLEANESSLSPSDQLFRLDRDYVLLVGANDSSSLANFGYSLLGGASAGGASLAAGAALGYPSTGASYSAANWSLSGNDTNITTIEYPLFPSGYSLLHIVLASFVVTLLMIVVVVGNMLVIIAIATEKALKNIQNWFIASLAVADFFLGLVIMPFSLANELMGYWVFGNFWCDIHSAMDVLLCTASIMNLCLISLDRYWSITQAVDYLKKRTPFRAAVMITAVWIMSGLICIPPLLGWKVDRPPEMFPKCEVSDSRDVCVRRPQTPSIKEREREKRTPSFCLSVLCPLGSFRRPVPRQTLSATGRRAPWPPQPPPPPPPEPPEPPRQSQTCGKYA